MNDERNEVVVELALYYTGIFLEVLRKTMKNIGLGGRCPGRGWNWVLCEGTCKSRAIFLRHPAR